MKFRDASLISTLYTKDFGKLKAVAKGARDAKSRYGAALQPMTYVDLVLYRKENRELQLISQCDARRVFKRIHSKMEQMAVGLSIVEFLDKVTHDQEEHPAVFSLVVHCLDGLENAEKNYWSALFAFEIKLAAEFGFSPSLQRCLDCGKSLESFDSSEQVLFQLDKGGFICSNCMTKPSNHAVFQRRTHSTHRTTIETLKLLDLFLSSNLASVSSIDYDETTGNELDETLRLYLRHHFEGLKPLKSTEVFHQLIAQR